MRLGISSPLAHASAEEWAKRQTELGCRAVVFPVQSDAPREKIVVSEEPLVRTSIQKVKRVTYKGTLDE